MRWIHHPAQLVAGDVCLLSRCGRLLSVEQLALHRHNLVVHESALPQGQDLSPMTWQILEGASSIPITLFGAVARLDAGLIYLQEQIDLHGHELVEEWLALHAQASLELCLFWLDRYQAMLAVAKPQKDKPSLHRRLWSADSQLDPERPLAEQFDLLRVVDNESYPAFFDCHGRRHHLQIMKYLALIDDS